ncbi:pyridoxal phosphate-dependent aminotransferase [Butyrivibrio sp. WCD3002]|uniref:pyridoxal phosphate-dependent aminotransferase n=1 Tax=Butyrivibrio sp. WCD3002 TaxID=1280676 RepID=UPI0003F70699|nr:histidinol-phosphate transaminase [Butyrivibrio sp. WCD3002]
MLHGGEIYDKKIEYDFSVNLNPYPCSEQVTEALRDAVNDVDKYPDITQRLFRESVAKAENKLLVGFSEAFGDESRCGGAENSDLRLTSGNIIGGNGASELIFAIVRMLNPGKVLLPVPSFYGYRHALVSCGDVNTSIYQCIEESGFELREDFADKIDESTDLVIITNPNNPTGRCIAPNVLGKIVKKCAATDTALIVDECFFNLAWTQEEYKGLSGDLESDKGDTHGRCAQMSAVRYLSKCPKLFIINAYTKLFSIPGVRVGYAISSEENIRNLARYLPEWNMSVFAQRVGVACANYLISGDFIKQSKRYICEERALLMDAFRKHGCRVYPSDTNFFLIYSEEDLFDKLLCSGILIRDCANFEGLGKGYYRIAVKDREANRRLIIKMEETL